MKMERRLTERWGDAEAEGCSDDLEPEPLNMSAQAEGMKEVADPAMNE